MSWPPDISCIASNTPRQSRFRWRSVAANALNPHTTRDSREFQWSSLMFQQPCGCAGQRWRRQCAATSPDGTERCRSVPQRFRPHVISALLTAGNSRRVGRVKLRTRRWLSYSVLAVKLNTSFVSSGVQHRCTHVQFIYSSSSSFVVMDKSHLLLLLHE